MIDIFGFIMNSDFKSIGNDAQGTISLTIPDTFTLNPVTASDGSTYVETEFHEDLVIGKTNAPMIVQMNNSRNASFTTCASSITAECDNAESGTITGAAVLYRLNPTTIRLSCTFGLGEETVPINCTNGSQIITAKIRTFIDPFLQ